MTIHIFSDITQLSEAAAQFFAAQANTAVSRHGRFLTALSGGSTPRQLFTHLSQPPYSQQIPWQQTHIFWSDERLVPPNDDGSNYKQAHDTLLSKVPIPSQNIHRALGEADARTAVSHYTNTLHKIAAPGHNWPQFDLILLGMGSDGHTASLFPGPIPAEQENNPVTAVTAHYDGRPAQRITFTPLLINDAHHILFLVTGASKAHALYHVLHGQHAPAQWPAQRIQPHHGRITWYVDTAAASQLPT
ncbi:MAG: 6-phosphogluconolactonase [Candidatus Promineifilaceae bacterium]